MKAIFLANSPSNIEYVYSKESIDRIAKLTDIEKDKVYTESEIFDNPEKFKDVEYIFSTWSMPGGGEKRLIDVMKKVKAVFYAAGSVRYFANEYLEKGARIFSAFAANAIPVAEFTLAQILLANKGYYQSSVLAKSKEHEKGLEISKMHNGNYDAKIGIIGAGMIGRKVVELLKPFRVQILIFDEFLTKEQIKQLGAEKKTLDELFSESDVISNHLANVPQTVGILTKNHFEKMKPYATFINTGRGAQVDEEGMLEVLKKRPDICAVLDVTIDEPPKPESDFYNLENVFLTPHIAGSENMEVRRMSEYMVDEFEKYLNNEPTKYEITAEKLSKMA